MQLILSSVLHVDMPTGNIRYADARAVGAPPLVASATPISLGDTFGGFRIVGTDKSFFNLYAAHIAQGRIFEHSMEAVLGAEVARRSALTPGTSITGSHGLAAAGGESTHGRIPTP